MYIVCVCVRGLYEIVLVCDDNFIYLVLMIAKQWEFVPSSKYLTVGSHFIARSTLLREVAIMEMDISNGHPVRFYTSHTPQSQS